jgi:hypothetical protein
MKNLYFDILIILFFIFISPNIFIFYMLIYGFLVYFIYYLIIYILFLKSLNIKNKFEYLLLIPLTCTQIFITFPLLWLYILYIDYIQYNILYFIYLLFIV